MKNTFLNHFAAESDHGDHDVDEWAEKPKSDCKKIRSDACTGDYDDEIP